LIEKVIVDVVQTRPLSMAHVAGLLVLALSFREPRPWA
jgi:hypothetical protein